MMGSATDGVQDLRYEARWYVPGSSRFGFPDGNGCLATTAQGAVDRPSTVYERFVGELVLSCESSSACSVELE